MKIKNKMANRIMSILLGIALLMTCVPNTLLVASADSATATETVVDPGTAHTWETMLGTSEDGNRYAGRVWVDKSVYKNGDTVTLNTSGQTGSAFDVSLEEDEEFQVIFSALGSSMTSTTTTTSTGPMDVVLVLDNSDSMRTSTGNGTRMQRVINAANELIDSMLTNLDIRLGIVSYGAGANEVLSFGKYTDGVVLSGSSNGTISAYNQLTPSTLLGQSPRGYELNTNIQAGFDMAVDMLTSASETTGRNPVVILLTDGAANTAVDESFYDISQGTVRQEYSSTTIHAGIALSTLLSNAYGKAKIEDYYGKKPMVYGIGVDLSSNDGSNAIINPKVAFNSSNANRNIRSAYNSFIEWTTEDEVTIDGSGRTEFVFDHNYPSGVGITDSDVIANINYVDICYDVATSVDELEIAFEQIYEELSSGVFNPISSTTTVEGATGVEDTPLIYVDKIGQHMEIKEIQAVTLFGASYGVVNNGDGTYTVQNVSGTNPTTNEVYDAEDIQIKVTEDSDGYQKLEIRINQEILPVILEKVVDKSVADEHTATINEFVYSPLRVFYTVGLSSDILLPNGDIDATKVSANANGEVTLYSNAFGIMNKAENDVVTNGDAHVGFKPASANRYYYHQTNQDIFISVTNKDGSPISWNQDEYGVPYMEDTYNFTWLTYDNYSSLQPDQDVYTYVTYYRPTASNTTTAEKVTYIVYTEWKYLKESVAFYDHSTGKYINYNENSNSYVVGDVGFSIPEGKVEAVIGAYKQENPNADIYGMLGVGSHRTSQFHNKTFEKGTNHTGTAVNCYAPEYTHHTPSDENNHYGNDVVVWLGNNGKVTKKIDTGIKLTKNVTGEFGNVNDTYELTVTIPDGVAASPVVVNEAGNTVSSIYNNNVLTVNLKAGETVYINGIPAGTTCTIDENIPTDAVYYVKENTGTVTVPTASEVSAGAEQYASAVVTNAVKEYGDLYITKEIKSEHAVPENILDTAFDVTVKVGTALVGETFKVLVSSADGKDETTSQQTVDANGDMSFQIKARETIKILELPAGTQATIIETNPGSHFTVSYRTLNHSGESEDTDNVVVIPSNGSATTVITNTYTPSSTSVNLSIAGTKNLTMENSSPSGIYTFKVQQYVFVPAAEGTEAKWQWVDIKSAEVDYSTGNGTQNGDTFTKTFTITDVLEGITYKEEGSWAYQVVEVIPENRVPNVTYDRTTYTFNVTVTDNGGQLVATVTDLENKPITDGSYEVEFNNTYHAAPVSIDIKKEINNTSGDNMVSKAGFEFQAVRTDAGWNVLTGSDASALTVYSDAAGEARVTATYTEAGTYYYVIHEVAQNAPGWVYSTAEYHVTVNVTKDTTNNLNATLKIDRNSTNEKEVATVDSSDSTKGYVSFENKYDPVDVSIDLDGAVSKVLTGKTLEADAFTFYVYADGDRTTPILTGTNALNGDVNFVDFDKALTFEGVGRYNYDVVESIPDGAVKNDVTGKYILNGMSYDPTIYDLVVEVTNNSTTGKLEASYYFEDAVTKVVTFHNSYSTTPTEYALGGIKELQGRAPKAGEFFFELYEGDESVERVSNKADGSFTFAAIEYTKPGTYTYTIKEVVGTVAGVTYNGVNTPANVTITVTDVNGELQTTASVSNTAIVFENTYVASPAQVTFNGTKTFDGDTLVDNAFTFNLYKTDSSFDITSNTAEVIASTKNIDGQFTLGKTLEEAGTYFFVIAEDSSVDTREDVIYDSTQYKFVVQVSDDGNGQLKATLTNVETGISCNPAASVSANVSFINATIDEVTEKKVYTGDTTTEVDGQKVNVGDILAYEITYTNYMGENVVVDILDTIPAHTSYVEGSATHNGTYAGTHLNWILDVPKGESVTVSFKVKVDEVDEVMTNSAVIRDGINVYTTNEVVNHTVEEPVKDAFLSSDPTISIDGQKITAGDEVIYTIHYSNIAGRPVNVTIKDIIPEHTTYVENSADNGGVYANGEIIWNMDLDAWEDVVVNFKVTVDDEGAKITNKATVFDGTNTYTSNEVEFETIEPGKTDPIPEPTPDPGEDDGRIYKSFVFTKVWNDNNDKLGKRPDSITVELYQDGVYVTDVILSKENGWTNTAILIYANGDHVYEWTMKEKNVPAGYVASYNQSEYIITNTLAELIIGGTTTTGDNSNLGFFLGVAAVSLIAIIGLIVLMKFRKKDDE